MRDGIPLPSTFDNQINGIKTPLIVACERWNITVVKHLIKTEVAINQSVGNKTPVIVAYKKNLDRCR